MYPRGSVPIHAEDQKILDDTRELCRQLNIHNTTVQELSWAEQFARVKFQPDQTPIYRGELFLHKSLIGKLTPEELRPLIASTLIHNERAKSNFLRGVATLLLPAILTMFIETYIVEHIFSDGSTVSSLAYGTSVLLGFGLVFFAFTRLWRIFPRSWFDADRETSKLLGIGSVLSVLEKMDSMGFGHGRPLREQPSIRKRMANLRRAATNRP